MENMEIAAVLKELGDLLEIQGSNPFRVRAYRNAVRTVSDLIPSLASMVEEGEDLTKLPGIGKEMASHIVELVEWGELSALEKLWEEVPRGLTDLIRLDGVGPKKAKRLWEELGVTSVDELEEALRDDRVSGLSGFGEKSAAKMARSVADFRTHQGRFLLYEADQLTEPLVRYLEETPGVSRVEAAGSCRRRQETVMDLDLLVLSETGGEEVLARFQSYPGAVGVGSAGESKGRILLRSGLPVDLRIIPRASYGAALHDLTGSKDHNLGLRTLGVRKGLRINEQGVFREEAQGASTEAKVGGEEEADVFRAAGLPWISPLLRENRGELEAARDGCLPELITLRDIRGDLQMHSTWSDGANSLKEMAEACRDRGYEYMSITDHSQAVTVAGGLKPERVRKQWEEVDRVRQDVEGIHLFRSLEVDILKDGSLDMPDELLTDLDLVLVSVHSFMHLSGSEMTDRVIRALEHPEVDILAHPTGRILNRRGPFDLDMEAVLQAAASLNVAVELNAHPSRLDLNDRHLRRAKDLGVKVAINTDAHSVTDLGFMSYGVDQAGRGWLEAAEVLNTLSLEEFQHWRKRRSTG
jgi:DNA polymerase (family 10)